jgi:radical SAM-linked protein
VADWCRKGDRSITASNETIQLSIRFRISGSLRFLSHAETLKLFQRACARADMRLRYSHGFNPRPKLSLPLPRSVGVETDDDLLCLRLETSQQSCDTEQLKGGLSNQLPDGCELLDVEPAQTKVSFQPRQAAYIFALRPQCIGEQLKNRIKRVLASESLIIRRRVDAKGNIRTLDVRGFLKSIEFENENIVVECKITPAGSIRVEEILKLLELSVENLAAPVRRTSVQWQSS